MKKLVLLLLSALLAVSPAMAEETIEEQFAEIETEYQEELTTEVAEIVTEYFEEETEAVAEEIVTAEPSTEEIITEPEPVTEEVIIDMKFQRMTGNVFSAMRFRTSQILCTGIAT